MLQPRRLGHGQNPSSQDPTRFSDRLLRTKGAKQDFHHGVRCFARPASVAGEQIVSPTPILLSGAGGGTFKPGRCVKAKPTPLINLFQSLADQMGVKGIEKHGDSAGRFEAIA